MPDAPDPRHRIDADLGLPSRLRRLRAALRAEALSSAPVGRVAREHGYAPAVLSRSFTDAYGVTPRDYVQRIRVHAAVVALLGGLSIAHAALDSGWGDLSRFYRQFRTATGQTPGRYRAAGLQGKTVK
jgi:AraC-like DNA-binding protein